MNTVTVRFEPTASSQTELQEELGRALHVLESEGLVKDVQVEAVFPGDQTMKYKGAFVVSFRGMPGRVVGALNRMPGVRSAYAAPDRAAV
jgi:hypothetical protein